MTPAARLEEWSHGHKARSVSVWRADSLVHLRQCSFRNLRLVLYILYVLAHFLKAPGALRLARKD